MTSARPVPMTDDHGDQFPGAVPAQAIVPSGRPAGADQRLVRMSAAYTAKVNAAVQADREGLAYELAERTFAEELGGIQTGTSNAAPPRRRAGRRTPTRSAGARPAVTLSRMGRLTRRSLDVFGPRTPHALDRSRSDDSA